MREWVPESLMSNRRAELKAMAFFSDTEWDHLLSQPAPFVPQPESTADTSYFQRASIPPSPHSYPIVLTPCPASAQRSPWLQLLSLHMSSDYCTGIHMRSRRAVSSTKEGQCETHTHTHTHRHTDMITRWCTSLAPNPRLSPPGAPWLYQAWLAEQRPLRPSFSPLQSCTVSFQSCRLEAHRPPTQ
jgi:hypothetical protein